MDLIDRTGDYCRSKSFDKVEICRLVFVNVARHYATEMIDDGFFSHQLTLFFSYSIVGAPN